MIPPGTIQIGAWYLRKRKYEAECMDCHRALAAGEKSWSSEGSIALGRRVCVGCMELRQAVRRTA